LPKVVVVVAAPVAQGTPVATDDDVAALAIGTLGTVGNTAIGPTVPMIGDTAGPGTGAAELTPRLPISKDPNGRPVRAAPPGVVGVVEVGVEDEAILLEPEPHMLDIPDVSSVIAEVADALVLDDKFADMPDDSDEIDAAPVDWVEPVARPPPS